MVESAPQVQRFLETAPRRPRWFQALVSTGSLHPCIEADIEMRIVKAQDANLQEMEEVRAEEGGAG